MPHSYQVIEIEEIDALACQPQHFVFAVAIYHWLIPQITLEMGDRLKGLALEVIPVTYMGSYPAIGVRTAEDSTVFRDVSAQIHQTALQLLRTRPVTEFARFAAASKVSWSQVTAELNLEP